MALNATTITTNDNYSIGVNRTTLPAGCLVLEYDDFIPWDNSDNIISAGTEEMLRRVKDLLCLPILFMIGLPANVINMAAFYRMGLRERINVCLFALSLADGSYLLCNMLWYGEQMVLQFTTKEVFGPVFQWFANHYLLGFYGFTWVSEVISAIIASERCFCILRPLRSHTVLKTSTTTAIVVFSFVSVISVYFVVTTRYYVVCVYDTLTDSVVMTSVGGVFYNRHKKLVDFLDVFVYGVGLPGVVMVIVTSTTVVTTVKLRHAAQWRAKTSSRGGGGVSGVGVSVVGEGGGGGAGRGDGSGGGGMSMQEIALTRMLVYNSMFFIACVVPFVVFRFCLLSMPEMNSGRRYHNFFWAFCWLLNISSYINATFNFIIYYTMGSRYRHTVRSMLGCWGKGK